MAAPETPHTRLYIRCSRNMTESHIRSLFSPFGEIEELKMLTEKATGTFKGIAFVRFTKVSQAAMAKEELNGRTLDGQLMFVQLAENPRGAGAKTALEDLDRPPYSRVYVTCPKTYTEEDLHIIFSPHGEVENINILLDRGTHMSRGTAFVKYAKASCAAMAVEAITQDENAGLKCRLAEPRKTLEPDLQQIVSIAATMAAHPQYQPYQSYPQSSNMFPHYQYPQMYPFVLTPEYPPIPASFYNRKKPQVDTRQRADAKRSENNFPPGSRLFISFSKPLPQERLQEIFRRYGPLEGVFLLSGKNYGYCKYATSAAAQLAIASLHERLVEGAACSVSISEPQLDPTMRQKLRPKPGDFGEDEEGFS